MTKLLSKSDIPIESLIRLLNSLNINAGYVVPTETGLAKSIMDAHAGLREFLSEIGIHDYEKQEKGTASKVLRDVTIVTRRNLIQSKLSLYRPETKGGDPRLWIYKLAEYAEPYNLLALFEIDRRLYVFNSSDKNLVEKITDGKLRLAINTPLHELIGKQRENNDPAAEELLFELRKIWRKGFIESYLNGDTAIGMTLERELGIKANSKRAPDYKGIEIKAKRIGSQSKNTLFAQVPSWTNSPYSSGLELLNGYGYNDSKKNRRQLYCTISNQPNPQSLALEVAEEEAFLKCTGLKDNTKETVVVWPLQNLKNQLMAKHNKTFWVYAASNKSNNGTECFNYVEAIETDKPFASNLPLLIEIGAVTIDFTLSLKSPNVARDHGYLFRIHRSNFDLLFPSIKIHSLESDL